MQDEAYRRIPLWRRDGSIAGYAVVDADDYAELNRDRWFLDSKGYARRSEPIGPVTMHRTLLNLDRRNEMTVDHINHDKLDNRRRNLRVVTHSENMQNRRATRRNTTGHRGVHWDKTKQRWRARVIVRGVTHHLGWFAYPDDAGRAVEEFFDANPIF